MFNRLKIGLPLAKRVLKESNTHLSPCAWIYALRLTNLLTQAKHKQLRKVAKLAILRNINIANYWLGLSYFLTGEYQQAEQAVKNIKNFAKVPEVVFLYAEICTKCGQIQLARNLLEQCALENKRKKVWIYLANLVETKADFERFEQHIARVRHKTAFLKNDLLYHQRINAMLRAGLNKQAIQLAKEQLSQSKSAKKAKKTTAYNDKQASLALSDLKKVCDEQQIAFFLISGTLLGCVREKKLLGHDKDIDVGVWENHSYDDLAKTFGTSGYFYVVPTRTKSLLMLRHVNGITIDVFIHQREPSDYWHAGVKIKWHNTPFELTETDFLGGKYLIPQNYDLYLTENYGDWRTPKTEFDSAFDTPNMEVINQVEMDIYLLKRA